MESLSHESLIPLADVPAYLPLGRNNKRMSREAIRVWARRGRRGVTLEFIWVGGLMYTSREALDRFFSRYAETRERDKKSAGRPAILSGR